MLKNRINGHVLAEDVVDPSTGEVLAEAGQKVDRELADTISECGSSLCMDSDRGEKCKSSVQYDG